MQRKFKNILVTGGCGFIGTNFIKYIFKKTAFKGRIINIDKLTYAGNPENLIDIDKKFGKTRYIYERVDINKTKSITSIFDQYSIDTVINFAAESHVDRSIYGPRDFIKTNILGTFNLLEIAKESWANDKNTLFHHISTDEVYGSLGKTGYFKEDSPYTPRSPYSASKASSDHLVMAFFHTYSLPATISNCSNNYGPYQFPEKLIPLLILNACQGKVLPIYGDGLNIRDWLFVEDHCAAIWKVINRGKLGETYNIGGDSEKTNIQVANNICDILEHIYPLKKNKFLNLSKSNLKKYQELITFVPDRPGHDRRYAINSQKIKRELGWKPLISFTNGLEKTIKWYLDNQKWTNSINSGSYRKWIQKNYQTRQKIKK